MKGQQKQAHHKNWKPKAPQLTASTIQAYDSQSGSEGSDNSFCLQLQVKCVQAQNKVDERPPCLITNLLYRLKMHEIRNLYLQARLDTCGDINIMPASVYKLVLSCKSTLALDLIQPRSKLDYLPQGKPNNQHTRSPQENQTSASTSANTQFQAVDHTKPISSRSKCATQCTRFPACARNKTAKVQQEDHKQGSYYETLPRCF